MDKDLADPEILVSQEDNLEDTRTRKMTEKGAEFKLQNIKGKLRRSVSLWRRQVSVCLVLLSDSDNCDDIRESRGKLEDLFKNILVISDEFYRFEDSVVSEMVSQVETVEIEHLNLMTKISEAIRTSHSEKGSVGSSRRTHSSHNLSNITKMEYLAETARLRTKLKFFDAENKVKSELEKIQTMKQLEEVNAKAEALKDADHFTELKVPEVEKLPQTDVKQYVRDYVVNQENFQTLPETSHTRLDPTVPAFTPLVNTSDLVQNNAAVNQSLIELAKSLTISRTLYFLW